MGYSTGALRAFPWPGGDLRYLELGPRHADDRGCAFAFGSSAGFAGFACVFRRGDLDEPHGQRAMGWPRIAHVRDRRRRRHLRHRRHQLQQHRHRLPGRVGEHRRRCATELSRGWSEGVSWGTQEVLGITRGFYTCTTWVLHGFLHVYHMGTTPVGTQGVPKGYSRGTQGVLRGV
jgi:hypothetical protein